MRRSGVYCFLVMLFFAGATSAQPLAVAAEKVVFGGESTFPPLEWIEDGKPQGFNVDLGHAIAAAGGKRVEYRLAPWPEVMRGLQDGGIDVVAMYRSEARERELLLTDAYYYLYHGIFGRRGSKPVTTPKALSQRRVAVLESSFAYLHLRAEVPDAIAVTFPTELATMESVGAGLADYALLTPLSAERMIEQRGYDLVQHGTPFWPVAYVFAVRKDRTDLAAWVRESLIKVNATGRYSEIYESWKEALVPTGSGEMRWRTFATTTAILLGLLLLSAFWYLSLKRLVRLRTEELSLALRNKERAQEELTQLARYDSATDLARPAHFITEVNARMEEARRRAQNEAQELLIVKLVDLNEVVRTFGFARANEIISSFARTIRGISPLVSAYLGRGVFAIYMNGVGSEAAAQRLVSEFKATRSAFPVRIGCGSAQWPIHGADADALMAKAEIALVASTQHKRMWTRYDQRLEPNIRNLDIVAAFAKGTVEGLFPVFQPQLNLATGELDGAEVLARWNHPDYGVIEPSLFVPTLERAGLIGMLTTMMIDHACRVEKLLLDRNLACAISVNVSAQDLIELDVVRIVQDAARRHGVDASMLRVELTETNVASDPERIRSVLTSLLEAGVTASVDDFGTGYSSMSYLSSFPLSAVKIDGEFVTDMLNNPRHKSIVRTTIAMAKELGMSTVAECVEDESTLKALVEAGCGSAQGYHVCPPLSEVEFVERLNSSRSSLPAANNT